MYESTFVTGDWDDSPYGKGDSSLPPKAPTPLGRSVQVTCLADASHASDLLTRRSHTGVLIYVNCAPIIWFSKKQNTVESSTYGSEFIAARVAVDLIVALTYKLQMFGVPVEGPANLLMDNNSVVGSCQRPEARLNKKHNAICFHRVREAVAHSVVRVGKENTVTNTSDILTKVLNKQMRRDLLMNIFVKGG